MIGANGTTPGIKVLSTLALMGAMPDLVSRYTQLGGTSITTEFAPTHALVTRIRAGEKADVAILTRQAIDDLAKDGILMADSRSDLALSAVGIAVRAGAPKPDIGTVAAVKLALLNAKSIAYSRIGASGVFFADLIERLGVADEVNAKATIIPSGFTAELAARGDVELAVQQVSELMVVPGIEVVGPLPPELPNATMFSAALLARSTRIKAARDFVKVLGSEEMFPALRAAGLEPMSRA